MPDLNPHPLRDDGRPVGSTPPTLRPLRLAGHADQLGAWLGEAASWLSYEVEEAVGNPVSTDDGDDADEEILVLVVRTADLRVVYRGLREASATLATRRDGCSH